MHSTTSTVATSAVPAKFTQRLRHPAHAGSSSPPRDLIRPADVGDIAFQILLHDGDLRRVWGDTAVRRGTVVTPALRAEALGMSIPLRGVIGRRSAAWVHLGGAPPRRAELLITPGSRRPGPDPDRVVFAASVGQTDVEVMGGFQVTTVQRTGLDIARCHPTEHALAILAALAPVGFDAPAAWRALATLAGHRGVLLAEQTLRILLRLDARAQAAA